MFHSRLLGIVSVAVLATIVTVLKAGEQSSCKQCGACAVGRICHLVCEEKKVTVTCWGCQEENFCAPGPGQPGCKHEEEVCDDCDPSGKTSFWSKTFSWRDWQPAGDPQVYTKRKLMKRTMTKKVPSYRWVIEDLCQNCIAHCEQQTLPRTAQVPPEPVLSSEVRLVSMKSQSASKPLKIRGQDQR